MKRMTLFAAAAFCLLLSATGARAQTSTWTIDKQHAEANFVIRHGGVSNVRGSFGNITGTIVLDEKDITKSSVTATIDTTTVDTGVAPRDNDLKSERFFDIAKYPTMAFKSTSITRSGDKLQMTGDLTLHGVTKSVTLDLEGPSPPQKTRKGGLVSGFSASGTLKRSDFGMTSMAMVVGDDVKFTIDVEIASQ